MVYRSSLRRPEHPLAQPSEGRILKARLVLYEKLNGMDAPCHWCCKPLIWRISKGGSDTLRADHLDGDVTNDDASNLVPSCHSCNGMRDREGKWSSISSILCRWCGIEFQPINRRIQYCSRQCMGHGRGKEPRY